MSVCKYKIDEVSIVRPFLYNSLNELFRLERHKFYREVVRKMLLLYVANSRDKVKISGGVGLMVCVSRERVSVGKGG